MSTDRSSQRTASVIPIDRGDTTVRSSPGDAAEAPPSPVECANALRRLTIAAEQLRMVTARHLGLSLVDSLAVSYLIADGPQEQHQLATRLTMTTGSITTMIDRLTARGYVDRGPHPNDRRKAVVTLTDSGRDRLAQAGGWMTEAFQHLDPDSYATAVGILDAVTEGLVASGETLTSRSDADTNPSRLR